eukprot:3260850-Amphidinium_carterae.2
MASSALTGRRVDGPTFALALLFDLFQGISIQSVFCYREDVDCMFILCCCQRFLCALPVVRIGVEEMPRCTLSMLSCPGPGGVLGMLERLEPGKPEPCACRPEAVRLWAVDRNAS